MLHDHLDLNDGPAHTNESVPQPDHHISGPDMHEVPSMSLDTGNTIISGYAGIQGGQIHHQALHL